jgi:hypothetical protein
LRKTIQRENIAEVAPLEADISKASPESSGLKATLAEKPDGGPVIVRGIGFKEANSLHREGLESIVWFTCIIRTRGNFLGMKSMCDSVGQSIFHREG